jgi:DNA-binding response OmpR family regulator
MDRSTLLVADPDALQRQLIDMMLSVDAFEVALVGTGQEALAYLREHTPVAMLLAVDLPDVDGFTLCQKVKGVGRLANVPVVLVADPGAAGGLDERTRGRARTAGADLLLQRPLGDKNLRERITQLILEPPAAAEVRPSVRSDLLGSTPVAPGFGLTGTGVAGQPATELGGLRAEVAELRGENASLKTRLAKYKALAKSLQEQLDDERKKPRGIFGRRG